MYPHIVKQDARIRIRKRRCQAIAAKARFIGYDCDWQRVNRHYHLFLRWDEGRLALGYLLKQTGMQKATRQET